MSIDEVGLQSPVVDPIDLITFSGVVAVSIRKALQLIGRAASLHASGEGVGILLKEEVLRRLRSAFTSSPKVQFKFTQKTLKHMRTPVISTPVSRQETCRARSGLSEGMYVDCELFWPDRSAKPRNLSERLTGSLGLDWKHYRVQFGDLVFSFSRYQTEERFRLDEIDAYTNPQAWKREALPAPPADAMSGYLLFNVPYDEQEVVYAMGDRSELVVDAEHARLRIRFPEVARDGQWIELADTLFALVDGADLLALQFEAFDISADPA